MKFFEVLSQKKNRFYVWQLFINFYFSFSFLFFHSNRREKKTVHVAKIVYSQVDLANNTLKGKAIPDLLGILLEPLLDGPGSYQKSKVL